MKVVCISDGSGPHTLKALALLVWLGFSITRGLVGSSQAAFGARSGATLLTRATSVLAALFVVLSLALTAWGQRGPGSVVGGIDAPPPAPLPAATTPAPATTVPAAPEATPPAQPWSTACCRCSATGR